MMMSSLKSQRGLSLIGMAIFMLVVGFMSVAIFKLVDVRKTQERIVTTEEKKFYIKRALARYVEENGRLPCPAPLTAPLDDLRFGVEVTNDCQEDLDYPGTSRALGENSQVVRIGALPTRTLNIDDTYMIDEWGHRFTYAVTEKFAGSSPNFSDDAGGIIITDSQGNNATSLPGNVIYVLMMHGSDKRGAYSKQGKLIEDCEISSFAGENCDSDADFVTTIYQQSKVGSGSFTHDLIYMTDQGAIVSPLATAATPGNCLFHVDGMFVLRALGVDFATVSVVPAGDYPETAEATDNIDTWTIGGTTYERRDYMGVLGKAHAYSIDLMAIGTGTRVVIYEDSTRSTVLFDRTGPLLIANPGVTGWTHPYPFLTGTFPVEWEAEFPPTTREISSTELNFLGGRWSNGTYEAPSGTPLSDFTPTSMEVTCN